MRPMKVERKMRGSPRTNAARTPQRPARGKAAAGAARRESEGKGLIARTLGGLKALVTRPILLMTLGLVVLALIAALLAGGYVGRAVHAVRHAVSNTIADAGFGISEIHISGNRRTPYSQVLEVLGMQPGQSIFSADLYGARDRLDHLEWIASAEVHRRYPDAIFVGLVEKRPFAVWQSPPDAAGQTHIAVVERSGGVITWRDVQKFSHLPKLAGAGAPLAAADLVDAVQAHRATAARIAVYDYQSGRRWNLILDDGVTVKLPETGWRQQLDALEHLIIDNGILERDVTEIDLRSPSHYFFTLRSGERKDSIPGKDT